MAITYGYFNSVNGDRKYDADQMSQYFKGLISNGVYANLGGSMAVVADGETMQVNVSNGRAIIGYKWIENDTAYPLTITQAHATLSRYTAVVVQLDEVDRLIRITTKDGTPASTPTQPAIDTSTELCLAMILVPAGSTQIIQSRVIDKRGTSLCLWVTGLITQVDTNTLFTQWQTAFEDYYNTMTSEFNNWFETLTDELAINTYIQKFSKNVVLGSNVSNVIPLDMAGYEYDSSDMISVYVNGLNDNSYTLNTSGATPTITVSATANGTAVNIIVLKSKIGFNSLTDSNNNNIITQNGVNIDI